MLLTTKILLTIATLGYSTIPTFFDWNSSHAANPTWTGHARYHVVWQVASYDLVALLSFGLIWTAGADAADLWIPALLAVAMYGGFWIAWATRSIYGGILQDEVNGVPEVHLNLFGRKVSIDANVFLFLPLMAVTVLSVALVWLQSA